MYYFTNYYDQELKNRQVKSLKNLLQSSEKLLKNYSEESQISEIDLSNIEKLTQAGEKIGLLCRASLEEREKQEFDYFDENGDKLTDIEHLYNQDRFYATVNDDKSKLYILQYFVFGRLVQTTLTQLVTPAHP